MTEKKMWEDKTKGNYIASATSNNQKTDVSSIWPIADLVCADLKNSERNRD